MYDASQIGWNSRQNLERRIGLGDNDVGDEDMFIWLLGDAPPVPFRHLDKTNRNYSKQNPRQLHDTNSS